MFSFKSIYFVIFTLILCKSQAEISDKRLCVDENCSVLISVGKTLVRYSSIEKNFLSFAKNDDVKVYSHGAGIRSDLLGVEINGKRGYINKDFVRETQLLKRPKLLVDTELVQSKPSVTLEGAAAEINADPTQQPFEIIDGTRIPLDLASLSTEAPTVNIVNEESSGKTTKSLDSVPDNQNVNPAPPREPNIVNTEQGKNIEQEEKQQETELVNNDDDDDDDSDDEDDLEYDEAKDDENNNENESGNKETLASKQDSSTRASENNFPTKNPDVVANDTNQVNSGEINNASHDNVKTQQTLSGTETKEEIVNETNIVENKNAENGEKAKEVAAEEEIENNEEIKVQSSQNNEPVNNILASNNTEITENLQQEPNVAQINIERTLPLVNVGAIQKPNVEELGKKASKESLNEVETDSEKPAEKPSSLLSSTTETPIDIEIVPPVDIDLVTEDPVKSQNLNSTNEDSKNDTEDDVIPGQSLSSGLRPEFKDPKKGDDIKVEEELSGGLFDGLRSILSISDNTDDRDVSGENSPPSYKENELPEENVQTKQAVDSDSSVSDGILQFEQNNEPVASENVQGTTEQSDLPQNLNPYTPAQNNAEEIKPPDSGQVLDELKEISGEIIANIWSFFDGEKNEESVTSDGNNEVFKEEPVEADGNNEVFKEEPVTADGNNEIFKEEPVTADGNNEVFKEEPVVAVTDVVNSEAEASSTEDKNVNTHNPWLSNNPDTHEAVNEFCDKEGNNCPKYQEETNKIHQEKISKSSNLGVEELQILFIEAFSSDMFLYLVTTAFSVIFLVFGMVILDKCRREGPLIARINKLEQQLLTTIKENEMLQEKSALFVEEKTQLVIETVPNEVVEELNQKLAEMQQVKLALEEQVQALEKELDTSTEVGIELNKIITEMLNSSDGSEIIKENIEQMQKKLLEQQDTINTINETLSLKETENHELRLEMEISNRKVTDLQSELDRMLEKILKIEEERDHQHSALENEITVYQTKCKEALSKEQGLNSEIQVLKQQLTKFQRIAEIKVKEYGTLKESLNEIKAVKNNKDALKSLLEVSEIRAQLEQLKSENMKYSEQLSRERGANVGYEDKIERLTQEVIELRVKYEQADKDKVEINTKLQVLNNYFKEKEDQMQKEISKYESLWAVKEGEATSTTERIRYMQEELQNYKAQNESLKQEIVNQEVELKSQISMLEKKAHESWVANRQTERKLEEARQEAAQLRNRLTLRERAIAEGNNQNRMQSPLHQNGELPISPPPLDPTQSPPPLFNPRDHLPKSPPIPGMPPPFLPPPLGATPFIPPPPLDGMMPPLGDMGGIPPPHFMPPLPPGMFPGDHRPPPLGRMSSPPPVGGRYTPESTIYSDYDRYSRRSPSPPYDSEYGASPPPIRGYSPYQDRLRDDRREYKRPQARSNGRNSKGMHSSGSENDSLGKINKKPQRKV